MIVSFTTDAGHKYVLNHSTKRYVHYKTGYPTGHDDEGPMWNSPPVIKGRRVVLWTEPKPGDTGLARAIQTGIVREREVTLV